MRPPDPFRPRPTPPLQGGRRPRIPPPAELLFVLLMMVAVCVVVLAIGGLLR